MHQQATIRLFLFGLAANLFFTMPTAAQTCVAGFPESIGEWSEFVDGRHKGPVVDAAMQIFDLARVRIHQYPNDAWPATLQAFSDGKVDILVTALKSQEREETMAFIGPWLNYRWAAFKLQQPAGPNHDRVRIGVNKGLKGIHPIPHFIARLNGTPVWDTTPNIMRLLAHGDVDIVLGDHLSLTRTAVDQGVALTEVGGSNLQFSAHMAIRKDSPCMIYVPRISRAVRAWRRGDGHRRLLEAVAGDPGLLSPPGGR